MISELNEYHLVKYIIIGEPCVGKTSLSEYYVNRRKADYTYMSTIGVAFLSIDKIINEKNIRIHIWDTAGQERFCSIIKSYYRGVHGAFICFSLERKSTFRKVKNHIDEIKNHNSDANVEYILVGTHADTKIRAISQKEGKELADGYNMKYIEVSSKTGENVDKCFDMMNYSMFKRINNKDEDISYITHNPISRSNCCYRS
uniref:Ras family GTPase n=1 Tax=Mimivirus LCMiAC01 TaxID=2506608 RepID=A0A481Z0P6_9VIRU|nr:MAG: Ras family GTPase [Mimivirus LCMiAC01]